MGSKLWTSEIGTKKSRGVTFPATFYLSLICVRSSFPSGRAFLVVCHVPSSYRTTLLLATELLPHRLASEQENEFFLEVFPISWLPPSKWHDSVVTKRANSVSIVTKGTKARYLKPLLLVAKLISVLWFRDGVHLGFPLCIGIDHAIYRIKPILDLLD